MLEAMTAAINPQQLTALTPPTATPCQSHRGKQSMTAAQVAAALQQVEEVRTATPARLALRVAETQCMVEQVRQGSFVTGSAAASHQLPAPASCATPPLGLRQVDTPMPWPDQQATAGQASTAANPVTPAATPAAAPAAERGNATLPETGSQLAVSAGLALQDTAEAGPSHVFAMPGPSNVMPPQNAAVGSDTDDMGHHPRYIPPGPAAIDTTLVDSWWLGRRLQPVDREVPLSPCSMWKSVSPNVRLWSATASARRQQRAQQQACDALHGGHDNSMMLQGLMAPTGHEQAGTSQATPTVCGMVAAATREDACASASRTRCESDRQVLQVHNGLPVARRAASSTAGKAAGDASKDRETPGCPAHQHGVLENNMGFAKAHSMARLGACHGQTSSGAAQQQQHRPGILVPTAGYPPISTALLAAHSRGHGVTNPESAYWVRSEECFEVADTLVVAPELGYKSDQQKAIRKQVGCLC